MTSCTGGAGEVTASDLLLAALTVFAAIVAARAGYLRLPVPARVRAVAMSTTDGLKRGYDVIDTGQPISMPVGEGVMGRVFNVTGDAVDERGRAVHVVVGHVGQVVERQQVHHHDLR